MHNSVCNYSSHYPPCNSSHSNFDKALEGNKVSLRYRSLSNYSDCDWQTWIPVLLQNKLGAQILKHFSYTHTSKVKVNFPSQYFTSSVVTQRKAQDDTRCVSTTSGLSSRGCLLIIAEILVCTGEREDLLFFFEPLN